MKFWDKHSDEMRKARLLAASAIIYAGLGRSADNKSATDTYHAVRHAFELERQVEHTLSKEKE